MLEHQLILEYNVHKYIHKKCHKYLTNRYNDNAIFYIDGLQNLLYEQSHRFLVEPKFLFIHTISFSNRYHLIEKWL